MEAKDVLDRWAKLSERESLWSTHWQDVLDYTLPSRGEVVATRTPGAKRTEKLFDGTAPDSCNLLAATLSSSMTPESDRWFEHEAEGLEEDDEVTGWLERADDKLFAALAASNFYHQLHETFLDDVTVGTSALLSEERPIERDGFNGFVFRALTIGEYCVDTDSQGLVDTVYRRWTWTARQAFQQWGTAAGEGVLECLKNKKPDEEFEFIHAAQPRAERKMSDRTAKGMPIASIWVNATEEHKIREGGYPELPYGVSRWSVMSGEVYGRSPSMTALPDIKTLNLINRYGLEALPLHLYPPWLVQEGTLVGRLKLTPGATNVFDGKVDEQPKSMQFAGNVNVEMAVREYYEQRVRAHYNVDKLRLKESPQMTATEVLARQEELNRVLGPNVGRLQGEKLRPVLERCFLMMYRAGAFGAPPPQLAQASNLNLRYIGPLARAQRLAKVRRMQAFLADVTPVFQVKPDTMDNFDFDDMVRSAAREYGISAKQVLPQRMVDQNRAQRARQVQAAQTAEMGMQVADRLIAGAKIPAQPALPAPQQAAA